MTAARRNLPSPVLSCIAGVASIAGCAASADTAGRTREADLSAGFAPPSHRVATPAVALPPASRSVSPPDSPPDSPPAAPRDRAIPARQVPLIGLYGELLNESGGSGRHFERSTDATQITFSMEGMCSNPDLGPDAKWIAFALTPRGGASDIYIKPIAGRTLTQLTTDRSEDVMPAWHPSGHSVAFASDRGGNWDIYLVPREGGRPRPLTDDPEPELHPSWSPDGRLLAYSKHGAMSGRWEIWVLEIDDPSVRRFVDFGLFPEWCPDETRPKILFQRARRRGSRHFSVWTVDYVDGDVRNPTEIVSAANAAVINPAWSPDGDRVTFATVVEPGEGSAGVEQSDVWVVSVDGSGRSNLTGGRYANYQPVWGADGRVYFVSDRTGVDNIWAVSPSRASESLATPFEMEAAVPEPER